MARAVDPNCPAEYSISSNVMPRVEIRVGWDAGPPPGLRFQDFSPAGSLVENGLGMGQQAVSKCIVQHFFV